MNAGIFSHKSPLYPEVESLFCWQGTVEAHQHTCFTNDLFQVVYSQSSLISVLMLENFEIQTRNPWNILRHFGNKHLCTIQNVNTNSDVLSVVKHALSVHDSVSSLVNVCYSQRKHQSMISNSDLDTFLYTVTLDIELLSLFMLFWINHAWPRMYLAIKPSSWVWMAESWFSASS